MNKEEAKEALDYYISLNKPDYAVEITGGWGTGKTYFIKEYINDFSTRCASTTVDKWKKYRFINALGEKKKYLIRFLAWNQLKQPIYLSVYGIKEEHEIENILLVKALSSNTLKLDLIIFISLLIIYLVFYTSDNIISRNVIISIVQVISPVLLVIFLWFYKTFKARILKFLLWGNIIIFDDFERSGMSHQRLLAYINRYVEHLNKHVIVICNEREIQNKEKDEDKTSFQALREKVIGKTIELEQDLVQGMEMLLRQKKFRILEYITSISETYKKYAFSVTHPKEGQINYRVWTLCCIDFEKTFSNIDLEYFKEDLIIMWLLPNFFSLDYALRVYDFGKHRKFSKDEAKKLFVLRCKPDNGINKEKNNDDKNCVTTDEMIRIREDLKWFYELFIIKPKTRTILPDSIWESIIDGHRVDTNVVLQHWNLLLGKEQPLWFRVYSYGEKSNSELTSVWRDLREAYYQKSVRDPAQIASIFSSIENMVFTNCCLKVFKKNFTSERVLKLALRYIRQVSLSSPSDLRPIIGYIFTSCETYHHKACDPHVAGLFRQAFEKKCIEHDLKCIIPKRFIYFLKILSYPDSRFDAIWYTDKLEKRIIFEGQSSKRLLDRLLELPPNLLWNRFFLVLANIFETHYDEKSYIPFAKGLLADINAVIRQAESDENYLEKYQLLALRNAVKNITDYSNHSCIPISEKK